MFEPPLDTGAAAGAENSGRARFRSPRGLMTFDGPNAQARSVLATAQAEALKRQTRKRRKLVTTSTGDLLLALLQLDETPFVELTRTYGLDQDWLRALLRKSPTTASCQEWGGGRFTPGAVEAIKCGWYLRVGLGGSFYGPEHLLLGLASGEEGTASQILLQHGLDLASIHRFEHWIWGCSLSSRDRRTSSVA